MTKTPQPPTAERRPERIEQLGRTRIDDYAWLKDADWQKVMRDPSALRPDIRAHLEAENAYTKAMLDGTQGLQDALFQEMRGRIKEDDSSVPAPDGPFDYYVRYETGAQHPVYARRPRGDDGGEQVLLDADAAAKGRAFFDIGETEHSDDHALFAYAVDEQGSEYFRIEVLDLATGEALPHPVESSTGSFALSPDGRWLFWIWRDENGRPAKVFRRPARGGEDVLVYHEPDEGMFLSVGVTASRAFLVIGSGNHETSEARLIPAHDPTAEPTVAEPRREGVRYELEHWNGRFVVLTNADGAVDYKLCWAEETHPSRATWTDWIAHAPGRYITGMQAHKHWLVRKERVDANDRLVVTARGDLSEHAIAFDEDAYALGVDGGYEWDTQVLRFTYQSPTTPRSTYDYDMATRERAPAQGAGGAQRPRPGRLRRPPPARPRPGRRDGPGHRADEGRHAAGRLRAADAVRLRRLRHPDGAEFLHPRAEPCGPRLDLGHRPRPRRDGEGLGLVPGRTRRK